MMSCLHAMKEDTLAEYRQYAMDGTVPKSGALVACRGILLSAGRALGSANTLWQVQHLPNLFPPRIYFQGSTDQTVPQVTLALSALIPFLLAIPDHYTPYLCVTKSVVSLPEGLGKKTDLLTYLAVCSPPAQRRS